MLKKSSVFVAKNRLKNLVTSDRIGIAAEEYDNMCNDFYSVLGKYMDVHREDLRVEICRNNIWIFFTGEEN